MAMNLSPWPMCRAQALVGGLLAMIVPRARIVPAIKGEYMSDDPGAVRKPLCAVWLRVMEWSRQLRLCHGKQEDVLLYVSDECEVTSVGMAFCKKGVGCIQ